MVFHSFLMWVSVIPPSSGGAAVRHVNAGLADISCLMLATSLSNSGSWRAGPGRGQKKIQQTQCEREKTEKWKGWLVSSLRWPADERGEFLKIRKRGKRQLPTSRKTFFRFLRHKVRQSRSLKRVKLYLLSDSNFFSINFLSKLWILTLPSSPPAVPHCLS